MLAFFSNILNMNLRDHHDIPFALPLVAISFTGFTVAFIILHFIGNEEKEKKEQAAQKTTD
jgi:hypothetical protein